MAYYGECYFKHIEERKPRQSQGSDSERFEEQHWQQHPDRAQGVPWFTSLCPGCKQRSTEASFSWDGPGIPKQRLVKYYFTIMH